MIYVVLLILSLAVQSSALDAETNLKAGDKRSPEGMGITEHRLMSKMLKDYDKLLRPQYGGPAVLVNISMHIRRLSGISETNMEFTVDMYFREQWTDPRLNYSNEELEVKNFYLTSEISKEIWSPDLFFANEVATRSFLGSSSNTYLKLYPGGRLLRSTRYSISLACPMSLQYFPMDTQTCQIQVESYSYDATELRLGWSANKFSSHIDNRSLTNFKVMGYEAVVNSVTASKRPFASFTLNIKLSRALGYYLTQVYIPAALLVVVSWFSLWMNHKYVAERISLGVTTVLTITTLASSVIATSPKIPYVKAIDLYMGMCFGFVFAALMQSVAVARLSTHNVMGRVGRQFVGPANEEHKDGCGGRRPIRHENEKNPSDPIGLEEKVGHGRGRIYPKGTHHGFVGQVLAQRGDLRWREWDWADYTDRGSQVSFPLTFVIMNIVYWTYYLKLVEEP